MKIMTAIFWVLLSMSICSQAIAADNDDEAIRRYNEAIKKQQGQQPTPMQELKKALARQELRGKIDALASNIKSKTGVKVYYSGSLIADSKEKIRYSYPNDLSDLLVFMTQLSKEITRYSTRDLQLFKISNIVLCKNMDYEGKHDTGRADYVNETIFYDIYFGRSNNILKNSNKPKINKYIAHVIHHEIFHMMDVALFENEHTRKKIRYTEHPLAWKDETWANLNPIIDPKYYNELMAKPMKAMDFDSPFIGYVNTYALHYEFEDRAEIYAFMLTEDQNDQSVGSFKYFTMTDPIIMKKMAAIRDALGYLKSFQN